jgi:hypothetical protein
MPAAAARAEIPAIDGGGKLRDAVNRTAGSSNPGWHCAGRVESAKTDPRSCDRRFATECCAPGETTVHVASKVSYCRKTKSYSAPRHLRRVCRHVPKVLRQIRLDSRNSLISYERNMVR